MARPEPLVEAVGLGKAYRLYGSPWARVSELATLGAVRRHQPRWALREVGLAVRAGCALGVVGPNGAGKSTLLALLAGVTAPSAGRLRVRGRVASLLELGTGMHPQLTGRQNIALAGVLAGLSRRELAERAGAIAEFAALGAALEEPVRTYSTGMALRLGFAVALASEPDVLLLDEVLAVGDLGFQRRCVERVLALKRKGAAIVFCSHGLYEVRQLCDEALWLEQGRVAASGGAAEVTQAYAACPRGGEQGPSAARAAPGAGEPCIEALELLEAHSGAPVRTCAPGAELEVRVRWRNPCPARGPLQLGIVLTRDDRTLWAAAGTQADGLALEGERGVARLTLHALPLLSGTFLVQAILFDSSGLHRHHEVALERDLEVRSGGREVGLLRLPHSWNLRAPRPQAVERVA